MVLIKGWSVGAKEKMFNSWNNDNALLRIWAFKVLDKNNKQIKNKVRYELVYTPKKTGTHKLIAKSTVKSVLLTKASKFMKSHPMG